jgi:hypothetical protein
LNRKVLSPIVYRCAGYDEGNWNDAHEKDGATPVKQPLMNERRTGYKICMPERSHQHELIAAAWPTDIDPRNSNSRATRKGSVNETSQQIKATQGDGGKAHKAWIHSIKSSGILLSESSEVFYVRSNGHLRSNPIGEREDYWQVQEAGAPVSCVATSGTIQAEVEKGS